MINATVIENEDVISTENEASISAKLNINYEDFKLKAELDLPSRGVTVLFGHSGCGKTTCLRAIAGLVRVEQGEVRVNSEQWQSWDGKVFLPTFERRIGYVFQEPSLFPHLNVDQNLAYAVIRHQYVVEPLSVATFRRRETASGDCARFADTAPIVADGRAVIGTGPCQKRRVLTLP